MFYYYLIYFFIKKQAWTIWWGEAPTHGTYIAPNYLLTPDTERSLSQCGRVTFTDNIISTTTIFLYIIESLFWFLYYLPSKYLLHHEHSYTLKLIFLKYIATQIIILSLYKFKDYNLRHIHFYILEIIKI